jgi:hypothetical protein
VKRVAPTPATATRSLMPGIRSSYALAIAVRGGRDFQ